MARGTRRAGVRARPGGGGDPRGRARGCHRRGDPRPADAPGDAPPELRALVRAYAGLAEAASLEWLLHRRLTREQAHALLYEGFLALFGQGLDAIERARPSEPSTSEEIAA
jgi:hypothetical protein